MKYKCEDCGYIFDEEEADKVKTTYEIFFGVASEFPDSHPFTYLICPICGNDILEEWYEDEEEDEDESD